MTKNEKNTILTRNLQKIKNFHQKLKKN